MDLLHIHINRTLYRLSSLHLTCTVITPNIYITVIIMYCSQNGFFRFVGVFVAECQENETIIAIISLASYICVNSSICTLHHCVWQGKGACFCCFSRVTDSQLIFNQIMLKKQTVPCLTLQSSFYMQLHGTTRTFSVFL